MKKITLTVALCFVFAFPLIVGASPAVEENEFTLAAWIEEYEELDINLEEDFSADAVNRRIALELIELEERTEDLIELRDSNGWIASIRLAWLEHTMGVQLRRITMLVRSSERREAITEEIANELNHYLEVIKQEVRD